MNNTNKVIDIIQAYENDTLEFKPRDKPFEPSGKSAYKIQTILARLTSGNIDKFRIVDEYTKFEDAIANGGRVICFVSATRCVNVDTIEELNVFKEKFGLKSLEIIKSWSDNTDGLSDPYQKFRDAEKDPLKVVQYCSYQYNNPDEINDGELVWFDLKDSKYVLSDFMPQYLRIMQYVQFEDEDLKGLYKRDVCSKRGITGTLFIDTGNDEHIPLCLIDYWYPYNEAFEDLRFYDPDKTKFEDMPIFGKLIEVTE